MDKIRKFAQNLINQKKVIRSVQNALLVSFICLSTGSVSAIPLRFFKGVTFGYPLFLVSLIIVLSFIYGFLGIEREYDVLKEADSALNLNEKLSAAYQFGESDNPYSALLIDDAREIIDRVNVKQVFHIKFSKRDPFQPLLLALFIFLWMNSFTFLQISDETMAAGEMLVDTSNKIDAVNSGDDDKDIEDLAEEYRKLGQKIQDQFMNDQSIENEVEKLSHRLERKIEELSREGVEKDSQTLEEDPESEIYQLNRKKELSDDLSEILESLMKTFSLSPNASPGGARKKTGGTSREGDQQSPDSEERFSENGDDSSERDQGEAGSAQGESELEEGDSQMMQEDLTDGQKENPETGSTEGIKDDKASGTEKTPSSAEKSLEEEFSSSQTPGTETMDEFSDYQPLREEKQSGEFDDENIRGELNEGDQMKSFIRALPNIVEPTLEEQEILYFYRNQLENAVDKEILPENYQSVVRDYFLSIGVLNE